MDETPVHGAKKWHSCAQQMVHTIVMIIPDPPFNLNVIEDTVARVIGNGKQILDFGFWIYLVFTFAH